MNRNGAILVIEDNPGDQLLLNIVFEKLHYPNQVIYFSDGPSLLEYLQVPGPTPFLILSDIDMPVMDGLALRQKIYTDSGLRIRHIPYLFFSTAVNEETLNRAYDLSVQGFFKKPMHTIALENTIRRIVEYWQECIMPNNF